MDQAAQVRGWGSYSQTVRTVSVTQLVENKSRNLVVTELSQWLSWTTPVTVVSVNSTIITFFQEE